MENDHIREATKKVRLIDANALTYEVLNHPKQHRRDFYRMLKDAPTVEAVEVVHGRWEYYSTTMQECSICKRHTARHKFKYCPHCGAVMEDHYYDV